MNDSQQRAVVIGVALGLCVAVGGAAWWYGGNPPARPTPEIAGAQKTSPLVSGGASVATPEHGPVSIEVGDSNPEPTAWVEVYQPAKVHDALKRNPWLQKTLSESLGRGFSGAWAGFLGTRGADIRASFSGTVLELVQDKLLADPFRVVWFTSKDTGGTPAVVVPAPGSSATAAFAALDAAARRGVFTATHCPGTEEQKDAPPIEISRWLLAEHSVFAVSRDQKLVFGRTPLSVLAALCTEVKIAAPAAGVDLEVVLGGEPLGREAQLITSAIGLGASARLQFAFEGGELQPRGLAAELAKADRLDVAAPSEDLLKLVPEQMPVVLALQLKLPTELSNDGFAKLWKGESVPTTTRPVTLLWNPRGDGLKPEAAIAWGRIADQAALGRLFPANGLERKTICGHLVLASTPALLAQIDAACRGEKPSLSHAAPGVLAGLRVPSSVALGVHVGHLLSGLLLDGYWNEHGGPGAGGSNHAAPKEIEAAARELDELPYFGFRGVAAPGALQPGGFRS